MVNASPAAGAEALASGETLGARSGVSQGELGTWVALGIAALGLAGLLAVLLAVSRIPGVEVIAFWPLDFFYKGLVIHVDFSLIVWFLTVFALLLSLAASKIEGGLRFAGLGKAGAAAVAISYPLLFLTAFDPKSDPSLNNYIPVIQHPAFYAGLVLLALGILLPVVRLIVNLRFYPVGVPLVSLAVMATGAVLYYFVGHPATTSLIVLPLIYLLVVSLRPMEMPPLTLAMTAGAAIYLIALICFGLAAYVSWGTPVSHEFNEKLFWGGGHILQFVFCLIMLTGWFILSRSSLGEKAVEPDVFRIAVLMLAGFTLAAPFFFRAFGMSSPWFLVAFSKLQFAMVLPALMVAFTLLASTLRVQQSQPLPWRNPAFLALVLSAAVFGVGGVMGNLLSWAPGVTLDTRTPAHYHAVIAGVQLTAMALVLTFCLPALGRTADSWIVHPRVWRLNATVDLVRLQIWLFGTGQIIACIGLFWAGGYGAPRKSPTSIGSLLDGAVMGMSLHGIGALFAVAGGVLFVVTVARALWFTGRKSAAAV
jgi:hypothetical protein